MNAKLPKGKKVVNAGIALPPSLIRRLEAEKGDYSKSKFAAIIIRQYFEALEREPGSAFHRKRHHHTLNHQTERTKV